ncbi:MAG: hypothetical protein LBQ88_09720 [Treponema sp.]|nr:hypothetical protein [Treponema sp.]
MNIPVSGIVRDNSAYVGYRRNDEAEDEGPVFADKEGDYPLHTAAPMRPWRTTRAKPPRTTPSNTALPVSLTCCCKRGINGKRNLTTDFTDTTDKEEENHERHWEIIYAA